MLFKACFFPGLELHLISWCFCPCLFICISYLILKWSSKNNAKLSTALHYFLFIFPSIASYFISNYSFFSLTFHFCSSPSVDPISHVCENNESREHTQEETHAHCSSQTHGCDRIKAQRGPTVDGRAVQHEEKCATTWNWKGTHTCTSYLFINLFLIWFKVKML